MTKEEAFNIGLPKWTQMLVYGKPVSKELAEDIILRTDYFFCGRLHCNDTEFNKEVDKVFGFLRDPREYATDYKPEELKKALDIHESIYTKISLGLTHLTNEWCSSCFVEGAHGWMHPDGTIGFKDNIGKHAEVSEVWEDLEKIASTWKELEFYVTLMSGEECETYTRPLVTLKVDKGQVSVYGVEPPTDKGTVDPFRCKTNGLIANRFQGLISDGHYYSVDYLKEVFLPKVKALLIHKGKRLLD